ncbi:unnamed protein product [Heligmosomoides polygyrus]|uniref:SMP-LTD domain-containing protein n=1 Tax=Heligmosomoides polygyrus TaxID=6339 RepID=A0A183GQE0_HELPZ|nr:unnamed protein product [Heligmosomoides polygyrus]
MDPPSDFKELIEKFVDKWWPKLQSRIKSWISGEAAPSFPVMGSKGFKIALEKAADRLNAVVNPSADASENDHGEPMETGTAAAESGSAAETVDVFENSRDDHGGVVHKWTIVIETKAATASRSAEGAGVEQEQ